MAASLQLGLKQSHKLVITQSLRQSIEMLQYSTVEIAEKISEELITNPAIEEDQQKQQQTTPNEDISLLSTLNRDLSGDESFSNRSEDRQNIFGDSSDSGYSVPHGDDDRKRQYIENAVAHRETLTEHLLWQARLSSGDENEYLIYQGIITSFDNNGFFMGSLTDFAEEQGIDLKKIEEILLIIQSFDPIGCGVRNVQESLIVQCRCFYPDDQVMDRILNDFFVDLEKLNYETISKKLNIPVKLVIEKSRIIQSLDPFPGTNYSTGEIKYIIPDVDVKLVDAEIIVTLNDDWVPNISVSKYYINLLKKKNIEKKQHDYIQDKVQSARSFIKNITSRRDTIIKVVNSIMRYQRDFLENGPGNLKHLTHFDVAEEIGMHESTVSRVTSNKFIQTSWGVFGLKYFFVSKIKSIDLSDSEEHSSDEVKSLMLDVIEKESRSKPLSDEEIVRILRDKGVDIARRTVAKYRSILNIPSSSKRRKINMIKLEESL